MQTKTKYLLAITVLIGTFAIGHYTAPQKIVYEKSTSETQQKDTDRDKHQTTVIIERTNPDGTQEKQTTITQDTKTTQTVTKSKETEERKEVTKSSSRLNISALAGVQFPVSGQPPIVYGAHISSDLIGPISVGVFGLTNGVGGFSLGLSF